MEETVALCFEQHLNTPGPSTVWQRTIEHALWPQPRHRMAALGFEFLQDILLHSHCFVGSNIFGKGGRPKRWRGIAARHQKHSRAKPGRPAASLGGVFFGLSLSSLCDLPVLSLCSLCALSVLSLCSLCSLCALPALSLCSLCSLSVT